MEMAVAAALVLAHDADRAEAHLAIAADCLVVGGRRVDDRADRTDTWPAAQQPRGLRPGPGNGCRDKCRSQRAGTSGRSPRGTGSPRRPGHRSPPPKGPMSLRPAGLSRSPPPGPAPPTIATLIAQPRSHATAVRHRGGPAGA